MSNNAEGNESNAKTATVKGATYNNRILDLRKSEGLTREAFAKRISCSESLVRDIENKKKALTVDNALIVAREFGVTLDWLYFLSDDINNDAAKTVASLRDVFKLKMNNKHNKLSVMINSDLKSFLFELEEPERMKAKNNLPDVAYYPWVDDIKKRYNEKIKAGSSDVSIEYVLVQESEIPTIKPGIPEGIKLMQPDTKRAAKK